MALVLALVPLTISVFSGKSDVKERFRETLEKNPDVVRGLVKEHQGRVEEITNEEFLKALPGQRLEGAFLPRTAWGHWFAAGLSANLFWAYIVFFHPMGRSTTGQLWGVGVFTGTIGILLLLVVQFIAIAMGGGLLIPRSILGIFLLVLQLIGYSYRAALDPENGFFLSMLGFTFGVGFCEELCKALPLLWHFRTKATLDVRGTIVWGLATGIGFGVSEGITYSSDQYNGIQPAGIYVVRFVSCVSLHAVWSASSALFIWMRQSELAGIDRWYDWFIPLFRMMGISVVLHGLYDTCLKREHEVVALLVGVASFAWFFWLSERARRQETRTFIAASPS
jgi:RsiW-degrading membrane proteinase PrsW (M82 family)